jgi:uncharacterized membrane protein YjfL (UPF0719 family)
MHSVIVLAYYHHSSGGLGKLFGLVAAVSAAVRLARFATFSPWWAGIALLVGWLVYRFFTRSRRARGY